MSTSCCYSVVLSGHRFAIFWDLRNCYCFGESLSSMILFDSIGAAVGMSVSGGADSKACLPVNGDLPVVLLTLCEEDHQP